MSDDLPDKVRDLLGRIRYQIFTPEVTTYGACQGCPNVARGAQLCYACLRQELAYIVGSKIARDYVNACLALRECEYTAIETAERPIK